MADEPNPSITKAASDLGSKLIAAMPPASVAAVKEVVDASLAGTLHDALVVESAALARLMATGGHREPMTRFLAAGGQTREAETARMDEIVWSLVRDRDPADATDGDDR